MGVLGIDAVDVWRVVAGVLLLGQLQFGGEAHSDQASLKAEERAWKHKKTCEYYIDSYISLHDPGAV